MKKLLNKITSKEKAPRELKDIMVEYRQLAFRAGEVQYVIDQNEKELVRLNTELARVNHEAAKRNALDRQLAEKQASDKDEADAAQKQV